MIDVSPDSGKNRFRAARVRTLAALVRDFMDRTGHCSVLDVGGTPGFWSVWGNEFDWSCMDLTCLNIAFGDASDPRITVEQGDARDLSRYADRSFDVVFSNSVIEHVGGWHDMRMMAEEIRRVGETYLVQTPYFWFPIEPHARTALLHWLPESLAYRIILARRTRFWGRPDSVDEAIRLLQSSRLVDIRQFRALFPDAEIERERFAGLTKSLIAVRRPPAVADGVTGDLAGAPESLLSAAE